MGVMLRPMKSALAALAACVALAACGGGDDGPTASPPSPSPTTATPSPTPTEITATVGQYAGIVAMSAADIKETEEQLRGCSVAYEPICGAYALTGSLQASTLALGLTGAVKPGVPAFIGAPPAELAKLVADTVSAAQAAEQSYNESVDGCAGAACDSAIVDYSFTFDSLGSVIDAWQPYL